MKTIRSCFFCQKWEKRGADVQNNNYWLKIEDFDTVLANCYLWSAVQMLAERDPASIKALFKTTSIN